MVTAAPPVRFSGDAFLRAVLRCSLVIHDNISTYKVILPYRFLVESIVIISIILSIKRL